MTDFNKRFAEATKDYPYIRFLSAKIDADRLKVTICGVYRKEDEQRYIKDKEKIMGELKKLLPPSAHVDLTAAAVLMTAGEIVRSVLDFFSRESVFVFSAVTSDDISVVTGDRPTITMSVTAAVWEYMDRNGLTDRLEQYLSVRFFSDISVELAEKEEDFMKIRSVLTAVTRKPKYSYERPDEGRTINPINRTPLYGEEIKGSAQYIADCIQPDFTVLYGTMTDVKVHEYTPRKSKDNEIRKFVTFFLDDTTGKMRCVFFPGSKSQGAIKYFVDGSNIIADGRLDYDERLGDGSMQFRVRYFSGCDRAEFAVNNVVRLVDDDYAYVFPQKYAPHTQASLYGAKQPLTDDPLVVFDVLTTSSWIKAFGELVEIGAVKLKDGKITETFHSVVRPLGAISEETRQELGFLPSDLAGKPTFDQVLPDFFRFFDGYALTAFPTDFNQKVLRTYLDKLHIPAPTFVDMTRYADKYRLKAARPKNTRRPLLAAEALAKILTNA